MIIGVHSDLHTEVSQIEIANLHELDVLILAGDIGSVQSIAVFFNNLRKQAPHLPVIYVLGNHEFYGDYIFNLVKIQEICQHYHITLLNDEVATIDGVNFIGSTLWTNFELNNTPEQSIAYAQNKVNDFRYIYLDGEIIAPADMIELHNESVYFIDDVLSNNPNSKNIVITHFLPHASLVAPAFSQNLSNSAYWANHLPDLCQKAPIWIYGHSHTIINKRVGQTQFISNQRGYCRQENQSQCEDYAIDFSFRI